ncbi:2-amino-4-hydroxy-6-hydroxymethyldihydropteridine diphosphokinase [Vibrio mangrovi]|uniref:2-amino-4-hydroxy-6-hydroxymethyldihydropteridine diphosphokinase n=1 Tax=Vibrio mangrovi TaxID=474394 RepID=A0A1Y6IR87_9VIBR|nr:2-amino-4-hydroxy-6-hydroxymethyldihydropteridine diphosphokinase [Vibrio mangrovi]MDW6001816.1 2-amino-4-hydroxy-6-hydroxymethyldihydropteridine diphosphokinase [Vibrio mangrovi]SMS00157.1 2-amino-4-hydroxy-6-hydroxymethyldihydropteridinepyrophosphokinase [Vibrio mangrovi]
MIPVYVGIGSNIDRHKHVEAAVSELEKMGEDLRLSTIYESPSQGFQGGAFFNLVIELKTSLSLETFASMLKDIEIRWGRKPDARKFQDRTLDLDIILFGDVVSSESPQLPRQDIYKYPFVIQPLFELCPDLLLPGDGRSVRQIWLKADNLEVLKPVKSWFIEK